MNIREATIKALTSKGYMYREDLISEFGEPIYFIKPDPKVTELFEICSLDLKPANGWQPSIDDLISDSWEVMMKHEFNYLREQKKKEVTVEVKLKNKEEIEAKIKEIAKEAEEAKEKIEAIPNDMEFELKQIDK